MGHFYSENVSKVANKLFKAHKRVSMTMVVATLKANGETIHAAEGEYDDDPMLSHGVEQLFFGLKEHTSMIEPDPQNDEQLAKLYDWESDAENFEEEDYRLLDSIPWKMCKGFKAKDLPVIDYIPS